MTAAKRKLGALVFAVTFTWGCGELGKVNQGRVVAYDERRGAVTVISDSNGWDPSKPHYDVLPPEVVRLPGEADQMGPLPETGKLMRIDREASRITVFDPRSAGFRHVPFTLVGEEDISNYDGRLAGEKFPIIDRGLGRITIHSPAERLLITVAVPATELNRPEDTWRFGDEVRYYYKRRGRALRMMNVTKTDVMAARQ